GVSTRHRHSIGYPQGIYLSTDLVRLCESPPGTASFEAQRLADVELPCRPPRPPTADIPSSSRPIPYSWMTCSGSRRLAAPRSGWPTMPSLPELGGPPRRSYCSAPTRSKRWYARGCPYAER